MNILITCGGTGGHIYPALSIADALSSNNSITFVGSADRLEKELVPRHGYKFYSIPASRKNPLTIIAGIIRSIVIIRSVRPSRIVSTGGYVTLPVCIAGLILNIPIVLQEQNTVPGKVNRLIGKFSKIVALGLPTHKYHFPQNKAVLTGTPIRKEFLQQADKLEFPDEIPDASQYILIFGGSQGARSVNLALAQMLNDLHPAEYTVLILVTGPKLYAETLHKIKSINTLKEDSLSNDLTVFSSQQNFSLVVMPYTKQMPAIMKKMDLVICRAGASTLTELSALGKPAILIPYPFAADDHQYWNGNYYQQEQAAVLIRNEELSAYKLKDIITSVLTDQQKLETMRTHTRSLYKESAAQRIAEIIQSGKN